MTTEALDQIRADLVAGIESRCRRVRSRRRMTVSVAAVALVAVIASLAALGPSSGTDALAITRTPEWIELRIQDATASPDQMNRELREAGVDAEVRLVPAPPRRVGTWMAVQSRGSAIPLSGVESVDDARIRQLTERSRMFEVRIEPEIARIPTGFRGHVILFAGREPRPGEQVDGTP